MTTIDQVVAANAALCAAIEEFDSMSGVRSSKRLSAALEEASSDLKDDAKKSVWDRFKAFILRIKDWFMGFFKKTEPLLDKIDIDFADAKRKNKTEDFAEAIRRQADDLMKESRDRVDAAVSKMNTSTQAAANARAEQAARDQQEKDKAQAARKAEDQFFTDQVKSARSAVATANDIVNSDPAKAKDAAKKGMVTAIRRAMAYDVSTIMRLIMSTSSTDSNGTLGKTIGKDIGTALENISEVRSTISNITKGREVNMHWLEEADKKKISLTGIRSLVENSDAGLKWVHEIHAHSDEEIISAYKRFCAFCTEMSKMMITTTTLRGIEKSLNNILQDTESLLKLESAEPAVVALVQKIYNEQIIPVSSDFSKIIGIVGRAAHTACKADEVAHSLVMAIRDSLADAFEVEASKVDRADVILSTLDLLK